MIHLVNMMQCVQCIVCEILSLYESTYLDQETFMQDVAATTFKSFTTPTQNSMQTWLLHYFWHELPIKHTKLSNNT